jgi:hypothetical protein
MYNFDKEHDMTKMNWTKVRQQTQMSRPQTDWTRKPSAKPRFIKPTEKQIKYMKALGIPYKQGMSLGDCSSLISCALEQRKQNPTKQVNN